MARAASFLAHKARGLQNLKMLGNGGTADRKFFGQFADSRRMLSQEIQDGLTSRIGEGGQHRSVSHT